jgi:hypothetical protein
LLPGAWTGLTGGAFFGGAVLGRAPADGAPPAAPYPVNYASAGASGGDWPLVMPELVWMSRDSPENPLAWAAPSGAAPPAVVAPAMPPAAN